MRPGDEVFATCTHVAADDFERVRSEALRLGDVSLLNWLFKQSGKVLHRTMFSLVFYRTHKERVERLNATPDFLLPKNLDQSRVLFDLETLGLGARQLRGSKAIPSPGLPEIWSVSGLLSHLETPEPGTPHFEESTPTPDPDLREVFFFGWKSALVWP
jgi:hypothetical protein